jgi:ABC-type bacteriocin/lantibiotic exporter with double-glycine peptidase domain
MARWRQIARLLEGSRRLVLVSLAISLAQSALLIPIALLVKHAFDDSIPHHQTSELIWSGLAIIALFIGSSALGLLTRWLALRATKHSVNALRTELLRKVYTLPRAYFDRSELGTLHSIIVNDSERLDLMANAFVAQLLPAATITIALSAALFVFSPLLAAVLFVSIPPMLVISRRIATRLRANTHLFYESFDRFSTDTQTALRAVTLTKLHAAEEVELSRRENQLAELAELGRRMAWTQSVYALINGTVAAIAGVVVLVVGGVAVAEGQMTLGALISFYAILGLQRTQMGNSMAAIPQVVTGGESLARLERLLAEESSEPYRGTRRIDFAGQIEFRNVSFAYGERPTLRDISLSIEPGERVGLVGPNGAGKSTVLSLLVGLYAPQAGEILADGVPLAELELAGLRRSIGVILQDPLILPATVRENIAYGRPEAEAAEVKEAAAHAGADPFIGALPLAYETQLGDDGLVLSGGQRQRIAIARALLGNPALLMLDEPTTYLDDKDEEVLLRPLAAAADPPSILIVSHDPAIASAVDRVYHLRDGQISSDAGAVLQR